MKDITPPDIPIMNPGRSYIAPPSLGKMPRLSDAYKREPDGMGGYLELIQYPMPPQAEYDTMQLVPYDKL